jgi:hypothetical protein
MFSQIWQYIKNTKVEKAPFQIVGNCDDFWQFFFNSFRFVAMIFLFLKQGVVTKYVFF